MFNGGPVAVLNFVGHPSTTDLIAQHVYCDKVRFFYDLQEKKTSLIDHCDVVTK